MLAEATVSGGIELTITKELGKAGVEALAVGFVSPGATVSEATTAAAGLLPFADGWVGPALAGSTPAPFSRT